MDFLNKQLKPLLEKAETGKHKVYFVDAAHFVMGALLGYLWCFARLFIPTASGRSRYNVLGALDAVTKELITVCNKTYINAESVCELLLKISTQNLGLPVTLVLDNARYQRCKKVQEYARTLNINLLFLPSYSPHLNLIERVWKWLKKDCLSCKYYHNFYDFVKAIDESLKKVGKNETFDKLLSWNFQSFENTQIISG